MIDLDATVIGPCMNFWGEQVQFRPRRGASQMVQAVYTDRAVETKFVDGDELVDTKTMLGCQASQFLGPQPAEGDIFVVRGRLWRVIEVIPDGHGHIRLAIGFADDQQAARPEIPPPPSLAV